MVQTLMTGLLVMVQLGFLGFTTFAGLRLLISTNGTWPYRIVSSLIMFSFGVIPLSMLLWPEFFIEMNRHYGPSGQIR